MSHTAPPAEKMGFGYVQMGGSDASDTVLVYVLRKATMGSMVMARRAGK